MIEIRTFTLLLSFGASVRLYGAL